MFVILFSNKNHVSKRNIKSKGFTLIEMAISMMIVGLILGSAMYIYSLYEMRKGETRSQQVISTVASALFQYKNANGRYPCPAPLLASRTTNSHYGHETDCSDPTVGTGLVISPGACVQSSASPNNDDGICIEASNRVIAGVNPRVRVGAIPFRDLQIDEKDTFDGYGSRIVYAVTETMGVAATFKDSEAAIELQDGAGTILSGGDQSVAFLIVSPGKNRNGAVSMEGVASICTTGANIFDGENCRDFASVTNTQSVYVIDSQASGTNIFDDVVEYFVPTEAEVWRRETPSSENIIDLSEDNVGVGVMTPADLTDTLTVKQSTVRNSSVTNDSRILNATNALGGNNQSGGLRIGKYTGGTHVGKVLADDYCTEDGSGCFSTERIAGTYDNDPVTGTSGMGCPAGEYMTGIEGGKAKCAPVRLFCPPGQAITGFSSAGDPICATPLQSCATDSRTICGSVVPIMAAGNGVTRMITYTTGGACAYANYTCNNGTWDLGTHYDTTFACTYTSATPPTGTQTGLLCNTTAGYTGNYNQNYYLNCSGNQVNTTNTFSTTCACSGITSDVYCPAAFGSTKIGTKQRTCTGTGAGSTLNPSYTVFTSNTGVSYPSEAAMQTALCSCTKTEAWEFANCPSGQTRVASPTPAVFASPSATWPGTASMGAYRKRNYDAATCTYSYVPSSGYNTSNCTCSSGFNWRYVNPVCPSCNKVKTQSSIRQIRSGASCAWIDDPDTSANTTGTCEPITYIWKSSGVSAGPSNPLAEGHGTSPVCSSGCACGENGSTNACALATASQWTYYQATCTPQ